jgi:hypothetical protein
MGLLTAALADAAIVERDKRVGRAPAALREPGADRNQIIISCQCWSAIVIWLEDDRFESFTGGEASDGPIIRWPELEAAAARALAGARDDTEANRVQKARLTAIHARVQRHRQNVDFINAEFRARRERGTVGEGGRGAEELAA